jgi:hypothetical protein
LIFFSSPRFARRGRRVRQPIVQKEARRDGLRENAPAGLFIAHSIFLFESNCLLCF